LRHDPDDPNSLLNDYTTYIHYDDRGRMWIQSLGGLNLYREETNDFHRIPYKGWRHLHVDSKGDVWLISDKGLTVINSITLELVQYPLADSIFDNHPGVIFSSCIDTNDIIWYIYFEQEGIGKFDARNRQFHHYFNDSPYMRGMENVEPVSIYADRRNRLWLGTTHGFCRIRTFAGSDSITVGEKYTKADGLSGNRIYSISEDPRGIIWMLTENGISSFDPDTKEINSLDKSDGLLVEYSRDLHIDRKGWIYILYTSGGAILIPPDFCRRNTVVPNVSITDIKLFDRSLQPGKDTLLSKTPSFCKHLDLNHKENFLTFEFASLNYLNPDRNRYRYFMDGVDPDTVDAGSMYSAEYRDMKPGRYRFWVTGSNNDGLWNPEGTFIDISIHPPWYRTILAYCIYAVLFILAVFGFIRWRTWRLQKEKQVLEKEVRKRTQEIRLQKEEIESQAGELLSQKEELQSQKKELQSQKEELLSQKEELELTLENLRQAQAQLIQSEKMAAIGGLVAGVAHEINTPVGISVTAASSLAEETRQMAEKYKANKISRAEFKEYLNSANLSAKPILSNMERAAEMVQSFKQVSVDQSTEQKRKFKLKEYSEDVFRSLYPKLKGRSIDIAIDNDEKLELNSYPGAYSQIPTNLVLNSLVHGFDGREDGIIRLNANMDHEQLIIEYSDDGRGISEKDIPRIFDPFFTTGKKAGTGLGLHIIHNLVNQKFNGNIQCESTKNGGIRFTIEIPVNE
jgi:signal transduction histidine kinase